MKAWRSVRALPADVPQGLGAPKRGIGILEIGKRGRLETRLRDPKTRQATLDAIARRVTDAILNGLPPAPPMEVSSPPDVDGKAPPEKDHRTSSEDG